MGTCEKMALEVGGRSRGSFKRFVEIGRVVNLTSRNKKYNGQLGVITDVIDGNRVMVSGPWSAFNPVDMKLTIHRGTKRKELPTMWTDCDVQGTFDATGWGKKVIKTQAKATATDFDRFKAMVAKKKINEKARASLA